MTELDYQTQIEAMYQQQSEERAEFLRKYYPIDPFNGAWVKAENLDPEMIARAYHCQQQINKDGSGRFNCSQNAVQEVKSPLIGLPLIRVATAWLEKRHQYFVALAEYTKAVIEGDSNKATEIAKTPDQQLGSLLMEVSEELVYWLEQTANASAEGEDQYGRDEC